MRSLFLLLVLRPLIFWLARTRLDGGGNIPQSGPAILASNHNSHLDTLIILCQFPSHRVHLVRPVAAADHFARSPMSNWLYRHLFGVVIVERYSIKRGTEALSECRAALSRNEILLIYPEGTRGDSEKIGPLKAGIARLSKEYPEVPVVPIYVHGTSRVLPKKVMFPMPGHCAVTFGQSFSWAGSRQNFMKTLRSALEQLQSEFINA